MKYVTILLSLSLLVLSLPVHAQELKSKIAKIGFSGEFMPFQENGHYSIHFDLENSTSKAFLTSELGAGFMSNGSDLYYLKFDYKFYPFTAIFNNFRYQGLYISTGPGVYFEDFSEKENSYGLGLFSTAGLQFFVNNRISLAFEVEMNLVNNFNSNAEKSVNDSNHAFHFSNSLKIGYMFNK